MINIEFTNKPKETIPEYIVDKWGNKCTYDENGCYHSYDDNPAVILNDNSKIWRKHGKLHRENDLPAIIHPDGYKEWWINGNFIRDGK